MDFNSEYEFDATPETVFDALTAPETVAGCLPGCEALKPLGDDRYEAAMTIGVAAIKGRFRGTVAMREMQRPNSFTLQVDGKGSTGFAKGEASIEITPNGTGSTVGVQSSAKVGGPIARVGQRLLVGTAKMVADKFFACLRKQVEGTPDRS
ncbi:MAG: carbon monoxide dehydrogenase subunit G [Bryobacterales bacterium]|nr:carbon monoxide dehydrogenase subunit G [Bryobacterales bacterium]MDE0262570.1 carbon monoxide dehydrogenase subunit G [Bryobacterales bacterium]MDE0623013.1 carbon monoxide dehydrogenase subunit G [Bryobacterales bacterium]